MPAANSTASPVAKWFAAKYGEPTPAQKAAWPLIQKGKNVLIASPTGTGKTFAAFYSVLDQLAREHAAGELRETIQCLYISPLRALGYDLEKNLNNPLREIYGEKAPIRVELRSGDTKSAQRAKQFTKPPHLLLTTPESLCLLLSQEKWLPLLASVRWLIIDEIHALADNKRGAHLALSVERLAALVERGSVERGASSVERSLRARGDDPLSIGGHPERSRGIGAKAVEADGASGNVDEPLHSPSLRSSRSLDVARDDTRLENAPRQDAPRSTLHASRSPLQRIGLSATIAPIDEVARFLTGTGGACEIVDVSTKKRIELSVYTPLRKNPYPQAGFTGQRLVHELGELIKKHRTTLVFTNTRSGAEATTFWLRENFPDLAELIECHHASLERDVRRDVEDRLKRGELRAVICSTSLELGIDIGSVDVVVMLATPKGVSRALQRAGRAGHNIHSVSRGVLMATNVSDLVEACATVRLARTRQLDPIRIPQSPLDVLAQHIVSMGCTDRWTRADALALVRRAHSFHELSEADFNDVLDYLAGGGKALRQQYKEVFGKIDLDDEGFRTREGRVRRDFMQNIGTIPDVSSVRIRLRNQTLGSVEESFIRQIKIGDVFIVAGRAVRLEKVSQMDAWVARADGATPTVPRWNAAKMPLSNRVCEEIIAFRSELRERLKGDVERGASSVERAVDPSSSSSSSTSSIPRSIEDDEEDEDEKLRTLHAPRSTPHDHSAWIAERLDCGAANARLIWQMHAAQHRLSEIPTTDFLLVEEHVEKSRDHLPGADAKLRRGQRLIARHYFFHSLIGRAANDALARVVAFRLGRLRGGNALATPHDYGFVLTVAPAQHFTAEELPLLIDPARFEEELHAALEQSQMVKHHFRNAAQTGLMIYRNYFDERKPVRKVQWSSEVIFNVLQQYEPDHVLLRTARREVLHNFVDIDGAAAFCEAQRTRPIRLRAVEHVPPLSFAMYATKIREALMMEDPFETMERLYHHWWSEIGDAEKEPAFA